jgi:hypothetical protein
MTTTINASTSAGLVNTADTSGILQLQTAGTAAVTVDASQNVGIGTSSPQNKLQVSGIIKVATGNSQGILALGEGLGTTNNCGIWRGEANAPTTDGNFLNFGGYGGMVFATGAAAIGSQTERMRIDSSGNLLVGTANTSPATANVTGLAVGPAGRVQMSSTGGDPLIVNRQEDGDLVSLRSAGTEEGSISVSGTTVSYNGGHLSRWAQTTAPKDDTLVKGTVLSNLDEMNVYTDADGNPVENEQLNKVKVSDVEGDANVAGVFVNWYYDEQHNVDEINMAMTGDMIIRIAQGTAVQRGDLLMSAGDGTAKPQGDDIVRSKTVAKVTSTHVTCTYEDGSFCVPCVLMAC